MADHVDITLWIDRRWKDAIEKHLKGETLQEHLENVLDELCNQLPEQEYERTSDGISVTCLDVVQYDSSGEIIQQAERQ